MTDDVRQAAEEALKWYRVQSPHIRQRQQAQLLYRLATGVLAEHPADEHEAITPEWLEACGFVTADDGMRLNSQYNAPKHHMRYASVFRHNNGQWWVNGLGVKHQETRGQLRLLCRALGIPLTEKGDHE